MAENIAVVSPGSSISSMREALDAQKLIIQQLSAELDDEREAAATAASEALSMILRLQGEKASLKMEASQYKRIAEEKMCHAEEALAVFEDLIYQRELEIASLEFQVQAYRYRLLSMGCNDLGVYETKYPENLLIQRNDSVFVEKGTGAPGSIRRLNSLPQAQAKDSSKRSSIESRRSATPPTLESDTGSADDGLSYRDINSYWEQIKKMDERVKEIAESRESVRNKCPIWRGSTWSPSMLSQPGFRPLVDATKASDVASSDQLQHPESPPDVNAADSAGVQDIFEIHTVHETKDQRVGSNQDGEQGFGKRSSMPVDSTKLYQKDDCSNRIRKPPHSAITELRIPKPRHGTSNARTVSSGFQEFGTVDSHAEYQQLIQRVELLEGQRTSARQEIVSAGEELHLLREIHEQMKSIQSEITKWRAETSPAQHHPTLDPLREAMLYFWL